MEAGLHGLVHGLPWAALIAWTAVSLGNAAGSVICDTGLILLGAYLLATYAGYG